MSRGLRRVGALLMAGAVGIFLTACDLAGSNRFENVPEKYASRHMPAGWWGAPSILEEGADIYYGRANPDVTCSKCHGLGGKPVMGARDLSDTAGMKRFSDSHLLWSVMEGVPGSRMRAYEGMLSEEQIWKVIAFISTFGLEGLRYDVDLKQWVPIKGG